MYPQIFGKYLLEREIAQGGMAVVHLATLRGAEGFEKRLVVKQIREDYAQDRDFIERFVREAKTNVSLNHPNIVTIYELGLERGTYFIAMEYIEGASISEILRGGDGRALSPREGAFLGAELARALDYAHRKMQVIHRDVTPRNVVVDEEGQVKLIDFGIAARVKGTLRETFGSPGHMAPEQIDGGELGPATDLFALAALLLEGWSGEAPFRRTTEEECRVAVFDEHRPCPSEIDPGLLELDAVFKRALSIDPKARPTFGVFEEALRAFVATRDPGTVARDLGSRAKRAREEHALAPTPKKGVELLSLPDQGESMTFATRASLRHKLDGALPAGEEASPSLVPKDDAAASRAIPPGVPSTRRLEAPKAAENAPEREAPSASPEEEAARERKSRLPGALALLIGAALLSMGIVASRRHDEKIDGATARGAVASDPHPTFSAAIFSSGSIQAIASTSTSARPPASAASSIAASASVSAPADRKLATVRFVGEPGTLLFVNGKKQGDVPRSIDLPAGTHDVKLLFEPTGESHGEVLHIASGDHLVLRSSFSGARPEVRVDREP